MIKLAILCGCASSLACAAHEAYGPGSDERLEATFSERASSEGADVASLKCDEISKKYRASKVEERGEADKLKLYTELFEKSRDNVNKLDDAVARNPDLLYGAEGDAIKANLEECRSTYADVSSEFDRAVRDLVDLPIIQEVQGRDTVDVARVDFAVLRAAINSLGADDKDVLLGKIDTAEKRVAASKGGGN